MICRHKKDDPSCSSHRDYVDPYKQTSTYLSSTIQPTPDSKNYIITRVESVCDYGLVLQVKYPNCVKCAYEGTKTLVILGVKTVEALRWKEIDPHFADRKLKRLLHQAPSPAARFPGDEEGWNDAMDYAKRKVTAKLGP